MNIDEVRTLKAKLEESIRAEVASFHRKTGIRVTDLGLICHEAHTPDGRTVSIVYEVSVRAEV